MYKLGRPAHRKRKYAKLPLLILAIALITATIYVVISKSSSKAVIKNSPTPLITNVANNTTNTDKIDESLYTMTLPGQWTRNGSFDAKYNVVEWQYNGKNSAGRWLRVYVDTIPKDYAVNYLLPASGVDDHIQTGQQSDNCVTFTGNATNSTKGDVSTQQNQASIPSRWQQVNFLCDNSHVSHQVVGTGSAEGINTVSVTGKTFGKHQYFFVYSDSDYHPDYSVLVDALASFKAK